MKITLLMLLLAIGFILQAQDNDIPDFVELDKNKDGMLLRNEIPNLNADCFLFADKDFNGELVEKEYKGYLFFQNKIKKERKLIPQGVRKEIDIPYVVNGHERQKLDLYLPSKKTDKPLPLVIWIHGGGWHRGSKQLIGEKAALLNDGFAIASVNYRLTDVGPFPMQIHDCKAAIRFLRKNANKYGIDPNHFGVWGASAGGHLVALLGTTNGNEELEGKLGVTDASSDVQAVCDWFGPTDFIQMYKRPQNHATKREGAWTERSPMSKLFGGLISDHEDLARLASPVNHVTSDDVPVLMMHGPKDPLVPLDQSTSFCKLLTKAGVECELIVEDVPGHGFPNDPERIKKISSFFQKHLFE